MATLEIITTSDGSHTLRNTDLNETYHSIHGAVQESMHVFIRNGLDYFRERHNAARIKILEIGFGTGLNAMLSLKWASGTSCEIHYMTLETQPLKEDILSKLNYPEVTEGADQFTKLHNAPWATDAAISPEFTLLKINEGLQDVKLIPSSFDIIYFDAFAPNKQPEMWDVSLLRKVAGAMKTNAVFVTYCAKGQVKRDLRDIGLTVETLPGPPGKEQMIRAGKYPA
jgi:tRNA U34 5-methylaminomethyl-2-thiouridine-forming methyltransferase MnmC